MQMEQYIRGFKSFITCKNKDYDSLLSFFRKLPLPFYRVSQQVWNRLRNVCEQSEHRLQKNCILLQKNAFSAFFENCKIENGFLSNFFPISNNLLNKLLHKTIGVKLLKILFSFQQFLKKAEKAFFWSKIHFFVNDARFARKHF